MPSKLVWFFAATFVPTLAHAGDVVSYQLEMQVSESNVDSDPLTQNVVALQDRTWATPGVEQSTCQLVPAKPFDFACEQPHFRFPGDGPYWLDDVCFPLTRQLFHECERYPNFSVVLCAGECVPHLDTWKIYLAR